METGRICSFFNMAKYFHFECTLLIGWITLNIWDAGSQNGSGHVEDTSGHVCQFICWSGIFIHSQWIDKHFCSPEVSSTHPLPSWASAYQVLSKRLVHTVHFWYSDTFGLCKNCQ